MVGKLGLIKAAVDAFGGVLADQWKDFFSIPLDVSATAAVIPAVKVDASHNRGSNLSSSSAIISNGSKIVVPEGYGLLLLQDGAVTAFSAEPGGYIWQSDDVESRSLFSGDGIFSTLIKQSWERFKFGGRTSSQQLALFIRLRELPNNKFGTKSPIYWDDRYLNAQVGAIAHGTYSVTIADPLTFAIEYVPAQYLQGAEVFDFKDLENDSTAQLKAEVVSVLASGFSSYANGEDKSNRIQKIQADAAVLAKSLNEYLEKNFAWASKRGLALTNVAILGIEYDESTRDLLKTVQRADALTGTRGNSNLQASLAEGIVSAGQTEGSQGLFGLGIATGSLGVSGLFQQTSQSDSGSASTSGSQDLIAALEKLRVARMADLITEEEFQAAKAKLLGL